MRVGVVSTINTTPHASRDHSWCSIHQTCGLANWLRLKMIPKEIFLSYIFHLLLVCTAEIKMRSPSIVHSTPQTWGAPVSVLNPPDCGLANCLMLKMIPREIFLSDIFHVLLVCTAKTKNEQRVDSSLNATSIVGTTLGAHSTRNVA